MTKRTEQEMLDRADKESRLWKAAFKPDGNPNLDKIQQILSKRICDGEPVVAKVVEHPREVIPTIIEVLHQYENKDRKWSNKEKEEWEKTRINELQPWNCIWDYWDMAFSECAYHQLSEKEQNVEFLNQTLFEAFEAGLGYIINLNSLIIGIALPKICEDDNSLIHNEEGPAITWKDEKQYFWHGTKIEAEWIEDKDNLDPSLTLKHDNQEMRRILSEIIGWEKIVNHVGGKTLQEDPYGILIETNSLNDGDDKARFVKVEDGTHKNKFYFLRVDKDCETAHTGVAATFRKTPEEYHPIKQT